MLEAAMKRTDLIDAIGSQLTEFSAIRDRSEQYRVMRGEDVDGEVTVCLGSGRCLFPVKGKRDRVCPFCLRVPDRHMTPEQITETVRRFVGGN